MSIELKISKRFRNRYRKAGLHTGFSLKGLLTDAALAWFWLARRGVIVA